LTYVDLLEILIYNEKRKLLVVMNKYIVSAPKKLPNFEVL